MITLGGSYENTHGRALAQPGHDRPGADRGGGGAAGHAVLPQPHISSGVADQGGLAYGVPLASFVVMAVLLAAGFGMLLTGASRSGARLRYGVLAVVTLLLAIQPVTSLISADAGRGYSLVLVFSAAQLAILAVWWMRSTRPVLVWVLLPAYNLVEALHHGLLGGPVAAGVHRPPQPGVDRPVVFDDTKALRIVTVETPICAVSSCNKRRVKAVAKAIGGSGITVS